VNRRHFLRSAAATGVAFAQHGARADAATAITTQLLWIKNVEYAGFWIADANGYFRDQGVTAAFLAGGPNLASVEAIVAGGRADVGIDELEKVAGAVARGADLVVVGAIYQRVLGGILSLPKNPVRTPADLVGKRIGLAQGDNEYVDGILRLHHLPLKYTEIPVGFDPQPLVEGACDAYMCYVTAQPLQLAERHIPYVVVSLADLGFAGYAGTLFCRREFAERNRAGLVGYLRALGRGWEANAHDPKLGASLTVTNYGSALGLDAQQQLVQNQAQIPLTQSAATRRYGPLWISKDEIRTHVYPVLRAMGRTNLPDPDRLVDLSYLQEANGRRPAG
jgi:ABC-type nitrate/sulfonate/bicarbonate transport system substrate-binding protein